ncbi:hypothetical protein [Limnochorda pilosa]|uniref:Uncharacterized protein n=1 Tax=Limnochorda pilosa TaxID=1555112 RepID=A0A0K2SNL7_LIMPI|nr:hypothetical protein [Limnochorda pilosa]BAS28723.1 hypothetical protein LIP_2894 [Limnochorda pilosa]
MRKKVATTLEAGLYARAKERARLEGRTFNALLEQALRNYLEAGTRARSVVRESAGVLRVPVEFVMEVVEADLYGEAD